MQGGCQLGFEMRQSPARAGEVGTLISAGVESQDMRAVV